MKKDVKKPIIRKIDDNEKSLDEFKNEILPNETEKTQDIM